MTRRWSASRCAARWAGVALLLGRSESAASQPVARVVAITARRSDAPTLVPTVNPVAQSAGETGDRRTAAPWWAPVASAVVPGSGQFLMGQQRSVAYIVAEAYLVVQALTAQRDGGRSRDEYRAIALDVARRGFVGVKPIGPWKYYETMEEFLASGVFSQTAGVAVVPETDESTYNGASWLLARQNNWKDPTVAPAVSSPEYQRALAFYVARAIRDEYRWTWRDARLQQDLYSQTIASANRSYQRALNLGGLVAANHLASLIDAYVAVRVRRFGGVRISGLEFDGIHSAVSPLGDPAAGRRVLTSALRFVPTSR